MRLTTIFLLALLLFVWKCQKPENEGDLSGKDYIRGRLFLFDQITQNAVGVPLKEKQVYLRYSGSTDQLNYLFSTKTDADGYFLFTNLRGDTSYQVYYEETVSGVKYFASKDTMAPIDALSLNAGLTPGQSGFLLTVLDETGNLVKDATICGFSSPLISGYSNNDCVGSIFSKKTNESGQAALIPLQQGTYYLNTAISLNGVQLNSRNTIQIHAGQIYKDTIHLKSPNGFRFITTDSLGNRLPGASICIFTSQILFEQDTCTGSNYQLTSSAAGEAAIYNLPPQQYFIYSTYKTDETKWVARETLNLSTAIVPITLILKE